VVPEPAKKPHAGQFKKGHAPTGGRPKGSRNKIPRTIHAALNRSAEARGEALATGDQTALEAFFSQLPSERLADCLIRANVPRATVPERDTAPGPSVESIAIVSVPHGMFVCDFQEAETLRKLRAFPSLLDALHGILNSAMHGDPPQAIETTVSEADLLTRLSALPETRAGLRWLLNSILTVAEIESEKRRARTLVVLPDDATNVVALKRSGDPPAAA
jgi:hypothetical protein